MARTFQRALSPEEQRQRRIRRIIYTVCGLIAVILLVLLTSYLRATGGPRLPAQVRSRMQQEHQQASAPAGSPAAPAAQPSGATASAAPPSPAPPAAGIPAGTPPVAQQVQQVRQAAQAGDTSSHSIYITDAELTEQLRQEAGKHEEVRDIQGAFDTDRAYLTARAVYKGREWNLTLVLRPSISDGGVRFSAEKAYIGQMAAPGAIMEKIQEGLGKEGAWFGPEKIGLYAEKVELKPGVAVVTGRPVTGR